VSVSLFDALVEWMSQPLYYGHYSGTPPARTPPVRTGGVLFCEMMPRPERLSPAVIYWSAM